ncbi:unnamed protein product [Lampetra fluviatilis]
MAEIYEPPSDAQRKFMHRRRETILDPLILAKMLDLSKEMGFSLPVSGHEPLTPWWAARCLDAKVNLRRWPPGRETPQRMVSRLAGHLLAWSTSQTTKGKRIWPLPHLAGCRDGGRWCIGREPRRRVGIPRGPPTVL